MGYHWPIMSHGESNVIAWKDVEVGVRGWFFFGRELWILTIWPGRRGGERRTICLTDDFNKDVARERGVSEITSWIIASVTELLCGLMGWLFTAGAAQIVLLYSFILLYWSQRVLGKWLTDSTTRQTHCQPFPLNLVPIHLFSPLSSVMQMHKACLVNCAITGQAPENCLE